MLALLIPGVGMGGGPDAGAAPELHLLPIMGVGRMWWLIMVLAGVLYGR